MKRCVTCKAEKPIEDFYKNRKRASGGWYYKGKCKDCYNHYQFRNYEFEFGITKIRLDELMASQDGRCPICKRVLVEPHVDHDHAIVERKKHRRISAEFPMALRLLSIRGVLCRTCNFGLGYFYDNPEWLIAASEYILRTKRVTT